LKEFWLGIQIALTPSTFQLSPLSFLAGTHIGFHNSVIKALPFFWLLAGTHTEEQE
jgi:hypothetical protein